MEKRLDLTGKHRIALLADQPLTPPRPRARLDRLDTRTCDLKGTCMDKADFVLRGARSCGTVAAANQPRHPPPPPCRCLGSARAPKKDASGFMPRVSFFSAAALASAFASDSRRFAASLASYCMQHKRHCVHICRAAVPSGGSDARNGV